VFELLLPPITTTASHSDAKRAASSWRVSVTLHIVSKIIGFVYSFLIISKDFFHSERFCVVCAAKMATISSPNGIFLLFAASSSSSAFAKTKPLT
jgi:hypothetical protein